MKRISLTIVTLCAFGFTAMAAGPVAPREAERTGPTTGSGANPTTGSSPSAAPTTGSRAGSGTGTSSGQSPSTATPHNPSNMSTAPGSTAADRTPQSSTANGQRSTQQPLPGADQAFIQKAAEMNQYQLEMSKAAARISTSPEIRKAAQTMQRDLSTVRQQLESLASRKGATLPKSLPQNLQDKLTAAESRTSAQFDQNYLQDQIEVKQQAITFFEREGSRSSDPDIRAWAEQTLPGLKNHLSILKSATPSAVGEKSDRTKTPAQKH